MPMWNVGTVSHLSHRRRFDTKGQTKKVVFLEEDASDFTK